MLVYFGIICFVITMICVYGQKPLELSMTHRTELKKAKLEVERIKAESELIKLKADPHYEDREELGRILLEAHDETGLKNEDFAR